MFEGVEAADADIRRRHADDASKCCLSLFRSQAGSSGRTTDDGTQSDERRADEDHGRLVPDPRQRQFDLLHGNRGWGGRVPRRLLRRCGEERRRKTRDTHE
jgi:hypothetical protein